jgi:hypothetical protein
MTLRPDTWLSKARLAGIFYALMGSKGRLSFLIWLLVGGAKRREPTPG